MDASESYLILIFLGDHNSSRLLSNYPELRDYVYRNYSREEIAESLVRNADLQSLLTLESEGLRYDKVEMAIRLAQKQDDIGLRHLTLSGFEQDRFFRRLQEDSSINPGPELLELYPHLEANENDWIRYYRATPLSLSLLELVQRRATTQLQLLLGRPRFSLRTVISLLIERQDRDSIEYLASIGWIYQPEELVSRSDYQYLMSIDYYTPDEQRRIRRLG